MKICIYSCVTNDYDTISPPPKWEGIDFVLFTDCDNYNGNGWDVRVLKDTYYKYIKMHPHILLPEYDAWVWMDASMTILCNKDYFLAPLKKYDFALFKHPHRNNVFQEINKCIELKKDTEENLNRQRDYIRSLGVTDKYKLLYQSGTIWIKNTEQNILFLETWYNETIQFSRRDQISIISTIHKLGYKPHQLPFYMFGQMIKLSKHKQAKSKEDFKIWEFVPYSHEKNFAKAINDYCALVPNDNDWIIIRDGDTSHTTSHWQSIVREVIIIHGSKYALFGAKTNRIGGLHQRIKGMFDVYDMREHWKKGDELFNQYQYEVEENTKGVAGFFMMFQKKTWNEIKFDEREIKTKYFDTNFYQAVKRAKLKCADIMGLYVFHFYRIWESNEYMAKNSRRHLY